MADLLSWLDPIGVETPLNGEQGYQVLAGAQGRYMPPVQLVVTATPQQPGARERYVQIGEGQVRLPLLVRARSGDEADLARLRRALVAALNPTRGPGTLRATAPDGAIRDLVCRLVDGLRGDESLGARGPGWFQCGLIFQAADPFWTDRDYLTFSYSTAAPVTFLTTPMLPLKLSSSSILSSFSVTNDGDVEAWPLWVITGPGSGISLANLTTGQTLALSANGGLTLAAGQVLTIDTRPGKKTVTREDGSNQFAYVAPTAPLWSLAPGTNAISLTMTGTTTASRLQLQYKRRYLGV